MIQFAWALAQARIAQARSDERGDVTTTVITIAVMAALALAVGAIISTKVTGAADAIQVQ